MMIKTIVGLLAVTSSIRSKPAATNIESKAPRLGTDLEPREISAKDTFLCDSNGQCVQNSLDPFTELCSSKPPVKPITRSITCNASTSKKGNECLIYPMSPYPLTVTKYGDQDVQFPSVLVVTDSHISDVFTRIIELYGNSFTRSVPGIDLDWVVMREGVADKKMAKKISEYFNKRPVLPFDAFGTVDEKSEKEESSCEKSDQLNSTIKWFEKFYTQRNRLAMERLEKYRKKKGRPNVFLSVGDNHLLPIGNNPIYKLLVESPSAWVVRPFKHPLPDDCRSFLLERYQVWKETCKTNEILVKELGSRLLTHKRLAEQYPHNLQAQFSYISVLKSWTKHNVDFANTQLDIETEALIEETVDQFRKIQAFYPSNELLEMKWDFVDWVASQQKTIGIRCQKKLLKQAKIRANEIAYYKKILPPHLVGVSKELPLSSKRLKALLGAL